MSSKLPTVNSENQEGFDSEAFLDMGASLLESNEMPEDKLMEVIKNTSVGIDLFMIGLARGQASSIKRVFKAMDFLEEKVFSKEFMEKCEDFEQVQLYKLSMESYKFRTDFVLNVQNQIDWTRVKSETIRLASTKTSKSVNLSKVKNADLIKNLLEQAIKNNRNN